MNTFTYVPKYGARKKVPVRVLTTDFGDGYRQRSADGLNTIKETWDLEFFKEDVDIDDIENFLINEGGYIAFNWTPLGEVVSKKFTCKDWNRTKTSHDVDTLTCTFVREFDL
jgi:phage-related protein